MPTEPESMAARVRAIQERIRAAVGRAGREANSVRLVAVSKTFGPEMITAAYECGLRHFGENRTQEFAGKKPGLDLPGAVFHLIGHLQSNKARKAVELFDRVDSVDSLPLARRLGKAAIAAGKRLPVLLQVRLGAEESKSGAEPGSVMELAGQFGAVGGLALEGVMAIPPYLEDAEAVRPYFRQLSEIAARMAGDGMFAADPPVLSMGMTHDFEVAIEEGATEIRLGTAVFGSRPAAAWKAP